LERAGIQSWGDSQESEEKGDFNGAIDDYNKAIAAKPDLALAYANRAFALLLLGRLEEAEKDLDRCFRFDSSLKTKLDRRIKEVKERSRVKQ
jgi:tetratricopeptide (TPR) repeat protein